jgi:hypothetical protein
MARAHQQQRDPYLPRMRSVAGWIFLLTVSAGGAGAQAWCAGTDVNLIRRAVAQRAARDADTLVNTWQAEAHGILRYASVLDHGDGPVERVIRADELRVEVYGESPNRSKQIITAWRDTSFLPNRINYHRDHLGIVANDFGATIRLGQGEEVRDLIHPLSDAGMAHYQFALGDTVLLAGPSGRVRVVAVQVRPANPDSAGTVGTLFLDVDRAALVRFQFTFTPASYRDHTVEDITVTLENALQENARWLPWRQSIVIRRGETLIDLPLRTVIRGDWTIDNYQLGVHHAPDRFAGPFIVGPGGPTGGGNWDASIAIGLATLPATEADVTAVEHAASDALGGRLLDGLPRLRFLAGGISDLLQVNRVEGITPAVGTRIAIGSTVTVRGRVGIGLSDDRIIGNVELDRQFARARWRLYADRTVRDVSDTPVISGVANSIGTLLSGDDHGDYTFVERIGIGFSFTMGGTRAGIESGWERATSVATAFSPVTGVADSNPALGGRESLVTRATLTRRDLHGYGWSIDFEDGGGGDQWYRVHSSALGHIELGSSELQVKGELGIGWGDLPAYRSFVLGGRGTLLGVPFRALGGRRMALAEVAWAIPVNVPTPRFPYSRYIKLPSTLAPYVAAGVAGDDMPGVPWRGTGAIEPVAGLRLDLWGPLLRIETGISLRTGQLGIAFDVHPDWWGLM